MLNVVEQICSLLLVFRNFKSESLVEMEMDP